MKLMFGIIFFISQVSTQVSLAANLADFKPYRGLLDSQKKKEAIQFLQKKLEKETDVETRTLSYFALGVLSYDQGLDPQAQEALLSSLEKTSHHDLLIRYYLGLSYARSNRFNDAKKEFQKVLKTQDSELLNKARLELFRVTVKEQKWAEVLHLGQGMEKKFRKQLVYPEILMGLIRAEVSRSKPWRSCSWAKKVYAKFPSYPEAMSWGLDLQNVQIDGRKLGCFANLNDQKTRLKNLQYAGLNQKAKDEIQTLYQRSGQLTKSYVDTVMANFLVEEGDTVEALKLLNPYREELANQVAFLNLLGKAVSRAGDFKAAIEAYDKVFKIAPRAKTAKNALFLSGYFAFHIQDFDGARKRFEQFVKVYRRNSMANDALWYLAWVSYFKGDYSEAATRFASFRGTSSRRRSKQVITNDRVVYWRAMSLMKSGKIPEAYGLFEKVAKDHSFGYYAVAAQSRLDRIKSNKEFSKLLTKETKPENARDPANQGVETLQNPMGMMSPTVVAQNGSAPEEAAAADGDEEEDTIGAENVQSEDDDADAPGEAIAAEGEAPTIGLLTGLKDPRILQRITKAQELAAIGMIPWARSELYEVEKRTQQKEHLKILLSQYGEVQGYHRRSYIGEISFGGVRRQQGFSGARVYWEAAYPKAFDPVVSLYTKKFKVPSEFVWSIMRAESRYYPDAQSNVGAIGLMQVMPNTGSQLARLMKIENFGVDRILEPELNIQLGSRYLKRLLDNFQNKIPLAAAAYNAGPHRVDSWVRGAEKMDMDEFIEQIPFGQTRNYVKKVVSNFYVYSALYGENTKSLTWLSEPVGVKLEGPVATREVWDSL